MYIIYEIIELGEYFFKKIYFKNKKNVKKVKIKNEKFEYIEFMIKQKNVNNFSSRVNNIS
jgi:hypothetical protein